MMPRFRLLQWRYKYVYRMWTYRDGPISQTDLFTTGATHMCLLHNAIIRGFNTIYLQAPHIQDADKAAFIGYSQTWFRFVKSHHDDEEDNLFPKVQDLLGDDPVWTATHEEHGTLLFPHVAFTSVTTNIVSFSQNPSSLALLNSTPTSIPSTRLLLSTP